MERRVYRAELVLPCGVVREAGWTYFLRDSDVWRAPNGGEGVPERIVRGTFTRAPGYRYSLDRAGNVVRIRRPLADAMAAGWPERGELYALCEGARVQLRSGERARLSVSELGRLPVPSGILVLSDPVYAESPWSARLVVPAGEHRVVVTHASLSLWRKQPLVATHLTILLSDERERQRQLWCADSADAVDLGEYSAVGVRTGTVIAVDAGAVPRGPVGEEWAALVAASAPLPGGQALGVGCGRGDGFYPIILGYDGAGRLAAVHLDFLVAPPAAAWE